MRLSKGLGGATFVASLFMGISASAEITGSIGLKHYQSPLTGKGLPEVSLTLGSSHDFGKSGYLSLEGLFQIDRDESAGALVAHIGEEWRGLNLGVVSGYAFGDLGGRVIGLEGGYAHKDFELDLNIIYYIRDDLLNSHSVNGALQYDFSSNWGVFLDVEHYSLRANTEKFEDVLLGAALKLDEKNELRLGVGITRSRLELDNIDRVSGQFGVNYRINFGKNRPLPIGTVFSPAL